ncbi:MAG: hypothetical protein ACRC46_13765 [Thermoguttaceae bacterium]
MSHTKLICLTVLGLGMLIGMATAQQSPEAIVPPGRPQTGVPPRGMPPMNPMVLRQAYGDMIREYRQIEQILGKIDPRDQRLQETLKSQRDAISEQLRDVITQLEQQGVELPSPPPESLRPAKTNTDTAEVGDETRTPSTTPPRDVPRDTTPPRDTPSPEPRRRPNQQPQPIFPATPADAGSAAFPQNVQAGVASSADQLLWNTSPIGQRTFDEIATLRTTVESLRSEVTSLREEIKNLTVQIQLLTRSVAGTPNGER